MGSVAHVSLLGGGPVGGEADEEFFLAVWRKAGGVDADGGLGGGPIRGTQGAEVGPSA